MRIELDYLRQLNPDIIKACMEVSKKKKILANLLKLMGR